jgi:glucuronide carrier protein
MGLLYSLVNIPFGSLAGAMSQNPVDRSRLASARMVGSGTTILLLALVLAPQIKASDNLATTFLLTAAVFVVIGTLLFATTFLTARETVVRDVAQVWLKQTIQTVTRNGPLMRLCLCSCERPL